MREIRSLHVSLGDVSLDALVALLDALEDAECFTLPATSYLLDDLPAHSAPRLIALTLEAPGVAWALATADVLHDRSAHALLTLPSTGHELLAHDLRALLGMGVAVGSSGATGAPLIDRPLVSLRADLESSREALSRACGYEVRALRPTPTPVGRAIDPMILEEAARAGYALVLRPSHDVLAWRTDAPRGVQVLAQRIWTAEDDPGSIAAWLGDERLSRARIEDALGQATRHGRRALSALWRGQTSERSK